MELPRLNTRDKTTHVGWLIKAEAALRQLGVLHILDDGPPTKKSVAADNPELDPKNRAQLDELESILQRQFKHKQASSEVLASTRVPALAALEGPGSFTLKLSSLEHCKRAPCSFSPCSSSPCLRVAARLHEAV